MTELSPLLKYAIQFHIASLIDSTKQQLISDLIGNSLPARDQNLPSIPTRLSLTNTP